MRCPRAASMAVRTRWFKETPPTIPTGAWTARPLTRASTTLRAMPSQRPAQIASMGWPSCMAWMMSVLAKTAQRVAMVGALPLKEAARRESSAAEIFKRSACCSMNDPVPAAQGGLTECSL